MQNATISAPEPSDAQAWFDFLVDQQATTYDGIVRPDFADVQRQFADEWVPELAESFANPGSDAYRVAKVDGELVGIAAVVDGPQDWEHDAGFVPSPADRELARLYVSPAHHGTGLAQELLDAVDDGRDLYLWLIDGNDRAHRFYQRRGFVDLPETRF